ncbi:MAG: hypothetical protein H7122_19805 [Chitinophagaceae bacterium]|nr:hypothetical protein [Chitinophagaceae bacterium]
MCLLSAASLTTAFAQAPADARPFSNLRNKIVSTVKDTVRIDSVSLIPQTVKIVGIADSFYTVDYLNALVIWKKRPLMDSALISYRVFPAKLNASTRRMVYDSVMNNFITKPFVPDFGTRQEDRFFNFGNINYNGSFGRGISFGNAQDAVVTSNLNLQLSGYLADSIEIAAAITDNNIPIQPDGTTQQLNEFDRIFLQFKKKNWQLSLGDIDIRQNQSYFLSFYKRLQGISFETTTQITDSITNKILVSGSIAKGKFTRNIFQGQEGNQGPYRLSGANNEFFFIVLANTERVFIDGELLQRGEDQDYVINYNTAEIAFTPKRMITKDSRIQVEFEYSDRNFLNANLYLYDEVNITDKLKVFVSAFSNSDAKNSPINQTLDSRQKKFLDSIGGNINQAFYPNATLDTFSVGKILYKRIDTVNSMAGARDSIYLFSNNPDSARYSLSFIDVGQGNGDYIPDFNGANGKVYRWVTPMNGQKQGRYEPAVFLVTPKKQQIISVGINYKITPGTVVSTEAATSIYDQNTFSSKDQAKQQGYAAKLKITNTKAIGNLKRGLTLTSDAGLEFVDSRFRPVERIRNVEYTRDWGLPLQVAPEDETIITAGVQLNDLKANTIRYQFTNYYRSNVFKGYRNSLYQSQEIKGWKLNNTFHLSNVSSTNEKGYFLRPNLAVTRTFPRLGNYLLGIGYAVEHNEIRNKITDAVSPQSFSFRTLQAVIKSSETKQNRWGLSYFTRTNSSPYGKSLIRTDRSQNITLTAELLKNDRHQFRFNTTYRNLEIIRQNLIGLKPDNSLIGRAEYQVNEFKGLVNGNVLYEVGAGQEQKRDFAFLEVPAGQGEYTWIDYDANGIQSLNEFEVALFQDQAKYIRIFTPTNEFIKANYNTFNYSIAFNPRAVINASEARGLPKFFAKINIQSSLQINKKELAKGIVQFNPFARPLSDTSLITLNSVFINTFSFNRFSSKWGFDVNNSRNGNKSLLTYGYETRRLIDWTVRGRVNFSRAVLFDMTARTGVNELQSSNPKFGNRNYKIDQSSLEPRITFTKGANFRTILGYKFSNKENNEGDLETSSSHAVNTEVKYNILQSTSILAKFTFSNISFNSKASTANTNSPASYIMLDGLLPGKNFLWTLDFTKRLSNNLEFNIQYEGRKPGTSRSVHIGRASIRALL